jgi:16S rRNA (guanine527-N7)-methyltransferase
MTLQDELTRGLAGLSIPRAHDLESKLLKYLALVQKWNGVYNLTAIRDPEKMLTHHVLDSLSAAPYVNGRRVADIGSGAGFPGIPVALAFPRTTVALVESSHKKSAFLKQAVIELELHNVTVENIRAEAWRPSTLFDVVMSRAFSDLGEFVALAGHLCAPGGVLVAMKGVYPYEELHQIPSQYHVDEVKPLTVPGLNAERHLVVLRASTQAP